MDFEDFQPKINKISSCGMSIRSNTSKLSLRGKLSLGERRPNLYNDSQRLSPPTRHDDFWPKLNSTTPKPGKKRGTKLSVPHLPGPLSPETVTITSTESSKENNATRKNNVPVTGKKGLNFSDTNVKASLSSPDKRGPKPSPAKNNPSPCKSRRGKSSTSLSLPFDSKGFCPICQVPLLYICILPSVHTATCQVTPDNPECRDGLECKSDNFHHYRDYRHEGLAKARTHLSESSLLDGDVCELETENEDALLVETENEDALLEEDYIPYKRSHDGESFPQAKRRKPPSIEDEEETPFFNPAEFDEEPRLCTSSVHNPFLDPAELDSSGDEQDRDVDEQDRDVDEQDRDVDEQDQAEEIQEEERRSGAAILNELDNAESTVPCIPGVCDKNKLSVTVTLQNDKGDQVKVRGVGGPDGWSTIDGSEQENVCVVRCPCSHNLNVQYEPPQSVVAPQAQKGTSAAAMWAPLMRKMSSTTPSLTGAASSTVSSKSDSSIRKCPFSKLIPGTRFAVDAFNYGNVSGVKYYFLSHFHYDHYIGLSAKWSQIIYCSAITARLAQKQLRIRPDLLRIVEVDTCVKVDGVIITPLDANHCPGSLMLLFQLSDGTNHLHTGDFRASPVMESYSAFWNLDVHTLFLDTTYCNKQYDFPSQEEVVQWAADRIGTHAERSDIRRTLVVCGSYTIGKEKVFMAVAERLDCQIWSPPKKLRILRMLEDPRISNRLTDKAEDASVHVLPMAEISLSDLAGHLKKQKGKFSQVIGFRPSGWQYSRDRFSMHSMEQSGNVSIYALPYSEHSSYSELQRFVQFLNPRDVVPTVRSRGKTWNEIKATCQGWMKSRNASLNQAYNKQTSLRHWLSPTKS